MRDAVLWTTTFLEGVDKSGSCRLERTNKFLDFYMPLQRELGFSKIVLMDNGSPDELLKKLKWSFSTIIEIHTFEEQLKKTGQLGYPYCWRALYEMRHCILWTKPKKLIYIDTDSFVLSKRLAAWVREQTEGWNTLWCKRFNFPESSIHVLNEDKFDHFIDFTRGDYREHCGKEMERVLPFVVHTEFDSDRYGETNDPVVPGIDFYSQAPVSTPMKYGEW